MPKRTLPKRHPALPYEKVQELLTDLCLRFGRKYRGRHLDDLMGVANKTYMELAGDYDGLFPFRDSLRYYVWKALLMDRRAWWRRARLYTDFNLMDENRDYDGRPDLDRLNRQLVSAVSVKDHNFDLNDFLSSLQSADGRTVARLAVHPPPAVVRLVEQGVQGGGTGGSRASRNKGNKGGTPHPYRLAAAVRRHLVDRGWGRRRIEKSFEVVRQALCG